MKILIKKLLQMKLKHLFNFLTFINEFKSFQNILLNFNQWASTRDKKLYEDDARKHHRLAPNMK